jgi:hypothetical protein
VPVGRLPSRARVVGVGLDSVLINPHDSHTVIQSVPFAAPVCKSKFAEYELALHHEQVQVELLHGNKKKKVTEFDRKTMEFFMNAIKEGYTDQAFAYASMLLLQKSKLLAIKFAQELKAHSLADRLAKNFNVMLPSRFARPDSKPTPAAEAEIIKLDEQPDSVEAATEVAKNRTEPPQNPFSKQKKGSQDLFDELSRGLKRKPVLPAQTGKKVKK